MWWYWVIVVFLARCCVVAGDATGADIAFFVVAIFAFLFLVSMWVSSCRLWFCCLGVGVGLGVACVIVGVFADFVIFAVGGLLCVDLDVFRCLCGVMLL